MTHDYPERCPMCGTKARIHSSGEGTSSYVTPEQDRAVLVARLRRFATNSKYMAHWDELNSAANLLEADGGGVEAEAEDNDALESLQANPVGACPQCDRKAWKAELLDQCCNMLQPDGSRCEGVFERLPEGCA